MYPDEKLFKIIVIEETEIKTTMCHHFTFTRVPHGEGNGTPLQYSCLENPMDGGAWWAAVHGVTKSWIRLRDFTFTFHFHALEKEMVTHSSVLAWRIPGRGSLVAAVYGVAQSWTRLKQLSSSSSSRVPHSLGSNKNPKTQVSTRCAGGKVKGTTIWWFLKS